MEKSSQILFNQLSQLDTEQRNPASMEIDLMDSLEIVRLINEEDRKVAGCVQKKLPEVAEAVELVKSALENGGRLIYAGAGTSGRLGVIDAAECPPTFGTDPDKIIGLIAGGEQAMFVAQEGSEDDPDNGVRALKDIHVSNNDVICGLAASGRTPYVMGALEYAHSLGCVTIFICCVPARQLNIPAVDIVIDIPVGPEVIMGSTRMKSATAQKMVCNMITTGAMIRQGKIYENVMVDLMLTNEKLKERARRIIMMFSDISYSEAGLLLEKAGGHVKSALLMALGNIEYKEAKGLLEHHNGFIRKAFLSLDNDV